MGTPELCDRVRDAGDRVGEPAWPMPLPDDVRKGMDSEVADISQINAGMDRAGHMLQGGVFLSRVRRRGLPWAHLDIAGPAYHSGEASGYCAKGGTGVPVRTLLGTDRGHRRRRSGPGRAAARHLRRHGPSGRWLAAGVVVAHPLRVADQGDVVDRHAQLVRELPRAPAGRPRGGGSTRRRVRPATVSFRSLWCGAR